MPLYFERDSGGVPRGWLERVRRSLETIPPVFCTDRMVSEYAARAYAPATANFDALTRDELARIADGHRRIRTGFGSVSIAWTELPDLGHAKVSDRIEARVEVVLGELSPEDVVVDLVLGSDLPDPVVVALDPEDGGRYCGSHILERSGLSDCRVRVRARMRAPWDRLLSDLALVASD